MTFPCPSSSARDGRALVAAVLVVLVIASPSLARGAGALFVNDAGEPLVWKARPVPWNPDAGGLGILDHASALELVRTSFATWAAVPGADISFAAADELPVDVTAANIGLFFGVCDDGRSPIVFDSDGTITDALFGGGASNTILGFAGPECGSQTPPVVTEASAVLNGKFLDGVATGANPEVGLDAFTGVLVHELGHYVNLDHSQINLVEAFDGVAAGDDTVATMFPFLVSGAEAKSLARDDEVALAMLYPAATFASTTGRITGQVRRGDTGAALQGAFVIARNISDPRRDAIGMVSGARFAATSADPGNAALAGAYELPGLQPGASYTVEVEAVSPLFSGGSSVGPVSPPVALPGPPERWNGDAEAATNPPDDPDAPGEPIVVAAGATTTGIDIVLNVTPAPPNDDCASPIDVTGFPFTTTLDTRLATSVAADPAPSCVVTSNPKTVKSVWFRVTSPLAGAVTLSTVGSSYDTVLSVHTGTCAGAAPVGCDDDGSGDLAALLTFPVAAGTPYLVEVIDYASTGGTLILSATFDVLPPASCRMAAPGTCVPGGGPPSTDCFTEWLLQPTPPLASSRPGRRRVPSQRVSCVDGDPSCDFDGVANANGSCLFHVAVCLDADDPRAASERCTPTALTGYRVLTPSSRRPRDATDVANAATLVQAVAGLAAPPAATIGPGQVTFAPPLLARNRCSTLQRILVPVGTRFLRARASAATKRADTDQLRLRCLAAR